MLINEIMQANFNLVMADEVASCYIEILSICLRYAYNNRDIQEVCISIFLLTAEGFLSLSAL